MIKYKRWTAKEQEYLEEHYGEMDTDLLCKRLGISYNRLRRKVKYLGLGYQRESQDFITLHQMSVIMKVGYYAIHRYVRNGLPVFYRRFGKRTTGLIYLSDLMKWLENNTDLFSAVKIEYRALGCEPEWLKNKRLEEYQKLRGWDNGDSRKTLRHNV
jgi:hypothetical protein